MSTAAIASVIASGIGSLPGIDAAEAARIVAGELPDLPHVVELPARGPGADMVGRTMGLLVSVTGDFAVETTPVGWRIADAPGRSMRRAASWLGEDLDAAEESYARAPEVKAQLCGPWTLAAAVELRSGERAVRDPGARRDLGEALAEAAASHVREIRRRLPGVAVTLQIDEPALAGVLAGAIPTASGLATYRSIERGEALSVLRRVVEAIRAEGAEPLAHCCAAPAPLALLREAGCTGLSVPLAQADDVVAELIEGGGRAALGVIPALPPAGSGGGLPVTAIAEPATRALLRRLRDWGLDPDLVGDRLVVTPDCGLAGASPVRMRQVYAALGEVARLMRDDEAAVDTGDEGR